MERRAWPYGKKSLALWKEELGLMERRAWPYGKKSLAFLGVPPVELPGRPSRG